MRKRTSGECYSDEALLALLDGELAPAQAQQIRLHLNACWPCRSRAEMLARSISELSALLDSRAIPPLAIERARARLLARCSAFDSVPEPALRAPLGAAFSRIAFSVAASLTLCVLGVAAFVHFRPTGRIDGVSSSVPHPVRERSTQPVLPPPTANRIPDRHPPRILEPKSAPKVDLSRPTAARLLAAEVEAWHALHRVQACSGEPVEVLRQPDGRILVRGVVAGLPRLQEIRAAIGAVSDAGLIDLDLTTMAEAIAANAPSQSVYSERSKVRQHPSLAERYLLEHFRSQGLDGKAAHAEVVRISQQAVRQANSLLSAAWALRHLAERFRSEELQPESERLLTVLIRDHTRSIAVELAEQQRLLAPILPLSLDSVPVFRDGTPTFSRDWSNWVLHHFSRIQYLHATTLDAFAGGDQTGLEFATFAQSLASDLRELENEFREAGTGWLKWAGKSRKTH